MQLYVEETNDQTIWDYLLKKSWETLGATDIKAHIWVNTSLNSYGTADALRNFSMGENDPFQEILPGSFINFYRNSGSAHAVVFLYHVDAMGREHET